MSTVQVQVQVQQFSLRWNNYLRHVTRVFTELRTREDLVDVTLCCEGKKIRAHKMLLSACSSYFRDIFKENPCQHPVIIFRNVKHEDLVAIVNFMYHGEVNIAQEQLASFLTTAELLEVQGLTDETPAESEDITTRVPEEMLQMKPDSRKRKASIDEDQPWDSANSAKISNVSVDNPDCNFKAECIEVYENKNQVEIQSVNLNSPIMLSTGDIEICHSELLQNPTNTLNETKTVENLPAQGIADTEDITHDMTNDTTGKDATHGMFNWRIVPLQATDVLPDNIFTSKESPTKKLMFESKLEFVDKSKVKPNAAIACDICDKTFKHPLSLIHHKKIHKQNMACKICLKAFSRHYNLIRHMRTSHSSP